MMGERKIEDTPLPALFEQSQHIHSMAQDSTVDQVPELTEKLAHTDWIQALKVSQERLKEFISSCETLELKVIQERLKEFISSCETLELKVIQERLEEFISSCETLGLVPAEEIEARRARARKIARFKRQKAAESKLQEIKERKERCGRSSKAAALTTPVECGEDDEPDDDGEEEREEWLTTISLARFKLLGLLEMLKEVEMLSAVMEKLSQVPFYLGELTEKLAHTDRIQALKVTQERLKEFISFCETLELVPAEEMEAPIQWGLDPAARRARKIARFKRQRAAESKLQEIKERKERRGRSSKAAALTTPVEFGEDDEPDDDGEEERVAWLTTISLAICKALGLLEMLKEEEEMLSAVKEKQSQGGDMDILEAILDERAKKAETWHRKAAMQAQFSKPAQPITCAAFAQDVLEGRAKASEVHEHKHQPMIFGPASVVGGNLTTERERMAAQVFQPHHRMPTISIEEAGLREMEMMNNRQERNSKIMEEANSSWYKDNRIPATNDDDDDEAAEEKARVWDDWKDENPRGAGNKKLTPCG